MHVEHRNSQQLSCCHLFPLIAVREGEGEGPKKKKSRCVQVLLAQERGLVWLQRHFLFAAAVQSEELNWPSDLLSGAFWTQCIADLTVTEGFGRAVMQWVSAGAGLAAGTGPVTVQSLPTPVLGFATEGKEEGQQEVS